MTDAYLDQVQEELRAWEARGPRPLGLFKQSLVVPLQQAFGKFIPADLHEEVTLRLEQAMHGLHRVGHWLVDPETIWRQVDARCEVVGAELRAADDVARGYWRRGLVWAGAEGGLTGACGWAGFLLDVPALYALAMRTCQQIGSCYGYDVRSQDERQYVLRLIQSGSSDDATTKLTNLIELKKLEQALLAAGIRRLSQEISATAVTREVAAAVSKQMLRRKALQLLPIAGGLVGAAFNAYFLHDVAESAYMGYRRRKLAELAGEE